MELECVLLGLINLRGEVTGYELNRIMRDSTGYLISAPLSRIYPALRRLRESGLVSFRGLPIKNRLDKKVYHITTAGEQVLNEWLCKPIDEDVINHKPFYLKMSFSPLMEKGTILEHIDREIERLEKNYQEKKRNIQVEIDYLDKDKYDRKKAEVLWGGINRISVNSEILRLTWLKEWRQEVAREIVG